MFPQAQFCVTGVLGPHSNAHGPNEFLDIEYCKRVVACVSSILAYHGTRPLGQTSEGQDKSSANRVGEAEARIAGAQEDKLVQQKQRQSE